MTEQELFLLGKDAQRILDDQTFNKMVSIAREHLQQTFFYSRAGDTAAREQAYQTNLALDHLLGVMQQTALIAQQIEANAAEESEE